MITKLVNIVFWMLTAMLVAIQHDELGHLLIEGHKSLMAVVVISVVMALINALSVWAQLHNEENKRIGAVHYD